MEFPILETKRLYLHEITYEYRFDLFEYLSNDKVTKSLGMKSLVKVEETEEVINKIKANYTNQKSIRWGLINKENNKLIGTMGYDAIQIKNKRADIGYDINLNYWRQGFATEAMREIIKFGFDKLNLNRIGAVVYPDNIASINLLSKNGFSKEGLLREYIIQDNIARDTIAFSLLKKEYV